MRVVARPQFTPVATSRLRRYSSPLRRLHRLQRLSPALVVARRHWVIMTLVVGWTATFTALVGLVAATIAGSVAVEILRTVPVPGRDLPAATFLSSKLHARDGATLLFEIVDPQGGSRTLIPLHEMPRLLLEATIATEDVDFFDHPGFDVKSMLRAVLQNLEEQRVVSGASTITQQLARNIMIDAEERYRISYIRKLTELVLAYRLTLTMERDQILEQYLNEIYFGKLSYGIEAAAEAYFGKSAHDLTLAESAFLAGVIQAPAYYDPERNLTGARQRQRYVLERMVDQGYISSEEMSAALNEPLHFVTKRFELRAPHFVFYARDELTDIFGEKSVQRDGLHVVTTLDAHYQELAERLLGDARYELRTAGANNATLIVLDVPSGGILAMVGSLDYYDEAIAGQLNQALVARQSGPALLPLLLAASFDDGKTPLSPLVDEPVNVADGEWLWVPRNPDGIYRGPVLLRAAYEQSLLAPFVRMLRDYGGEKFASFVRELGVRSLRRQIAYEPDMLVRHAEAPPLEIAAAYATLARGGISREPTALDSVSGPDGRLLIDASRGTGTRVLGAGAAYLTTNLLATKVAQYGIGGHRTSGLIERPLAVHWGQTEDRRDTWVVGYTPRTVILLWVGNTDGQPTNGEPVLQSATRVWLDFAAQVLEDEPPLAFPRPEEIVETDVCLDSGCRTVVTEEFVRGTELDAQRVFLQQPESTPTAAVPGGVPTTAGPSRPATTLVVVPNVTGMSPSEATRVLTEAGIRVSSVTRAEPVFVFPESVRRRLAPGLVATTIPGSGQTVMPGTTVQLVLAAASSPGPEL